MNNTIMNNTIMNEMKWTVWYEAIIYLELFIYQLFDATWSSEIICQVFKTERGVFWTLHELN